MYPVSLKSFFKSSSYIVIVLEVFAFLRAISFSRSPLRSTRLHSVSSELSFLGTSLGSVFETLYQDPSI